MSPGLPIPETRVLAIASHVVYGYVGNTMAAFVMQSLGCEVAALNTVQFRYKQFKGTKASAQEIRDLYEGLKQSHLTDFDMMLSGYAPSADAVDAVGEIGRDLKRRSTNAGSFFWVLDPVMGDQGRLYVNEGVVPAYKNLLHDVDLILPNQFEAELLSEVKIDSFTSLAEAITRLHQTYRVPHIIVTSVSFDAACPTLSVVGSSARADGSPRLFKIDVPAIDCFFSGTGDMLAALTVVRLREAITDAGMGSSTSWLSPDDVDATQLPLAKAAEMVLASMHAVLRQTKQARDETLERVRKSSELSEGNEKDMYLLQTKAAEVRPVRHMLDLRSPKVQYHAKPLEL